MTFTRICKNLRIVIVLFSSPFAVSAQTLQPSAVPSASPAAEEEIIIPTFETQKLARTYILDVPAPRGQITDRNGAPLAQNRLSYNLAINFPTPLDFSDAQAISFAREKIDSAGQLIGRKLRISDEKLAVQIIGFICKTGRNLEGIFDKH